MRQYLLVLIQLTLIGCLLGNPLQAQDGRVLREIGRSLDLAAEELLQVIERATEGILRDPDNGSYYHQRANAYFDRGEYRKAIIDYAQAASYFERNRDARLHHVYLHRGLSYYILGNYHEANQDFSQVIQRRPDQADAYYFRGKIYHLALQETASGRADFQEVMRKEGFPSIQTAYARLFLGDHSGADQQIDYLLRQAGSLDHRGYAILQYNVAGFRALQGRQDEAVRYLRTALQSGYDEYQWLIRDINFRGVANYRPFQALLSQYRLSYQREAIDGDACFCPPSDGSARYPKQPTQPARLVTSNLRFEDGNGNNRMDAGEISYLTFTLRNEGSGTAREVVVQLQDEREISGLRFDPETKVGNLAAGVSRDIRLPLTGANYLQAGQVDFNIKVMEQHGFDASPLHLTVQTGASTPPDLVIADHVFASQQGGTLRLGVPITLRLAVQNRGEGVAQGVKARMRLPENVFAAGEQLLDLGEMAPGADQVIDFEFFTNQRFDAQTLDITVVITEDDDRFSYQEKLSIGINDRLEANDRVVITPNAPTRTDPNAIRLTSDVDRDLPRAKRKNANAIAVVIGNRDYQNADVPPVDHALQDAASMRKYLIESFGFDDNNILFISNATQADFNGTFGTKEDHRARLHNLVRANESDVFVFYSGHGAPDLSTEDAYFVPVDCDPSLVRFNGYAMSTLYDNLAKIPYRSLTVVIDACFSGASDRGTLTPQASIVRIRSKGGVLKDPKAMVFTAATGAQIASWYPDQSHGLFTYYFLKGLQGAANANQDRVLTLEEMKAYLDKEVPYMARRIRNREQTPEVYGEAANTVFTY
jgi:tetratricopeptide (TPR) repeat protein